MPGQRPGECGRRIAGRDACPRQKKFRSAASPPAARTSPAPFLLTLPTKPKIGFAGAPARRASAPTGRFCVALTRRSHGIAAGLSALRGAVRGIYPAVKSNAWIALKTGRKSDGWAGADSAVLCESNSRGFSTIAHSGPHEGQRRVLRHRRGTAPDPWESHKGPYSAKHGATHF